MKFIQSVREISDTFDVAVCDQWGVLHDGTNAYPNAAAALTMLAEMGKEIVVLSNSGKRAELNRQRIAARGLPVEAISQVITSGEALWSDLDSERLAFADKGSCRLFPICGKPSDPGEWAEPSERITIASEIDESVDAILLMGLPDGTAPDAYDDEFRAALELSKPLICSNPDKTSPRAGGLVISPGKLADRFREMGGQVIWYGKPNANVFTAVKRCFASIANERFLMIGDSLEHDVAGASQMGFTSAWIRGGIHAEAFANAHTETEILEIASELIGTDDQSPTYSLGLFA